MLVAQEYMGPRNPEGRIMTDDVANEAALRYICHNLYTQYAMLFMDEFIDRQQDQRIGLVEYAKMESLLPESWDKDLKQTEALLRSTADILVCREYKMPNFLQERVIYGLLEHAKAHYDLLMEDVDEEGRPEDMMSDQYRKAIEDGVRKHPEEYDYIFDTEEDEGLSGEEKLEREIKYVLDLVVNPHNYEDIIFMDIDFLLMDEFGFSESEIADTVGPMFGMSARTEKQQKEDASLEKKVSFELMEKKVYPFFYDLAVMKTAFAGTSEKQIKETADMLMALKPTTYIRYMYEDIINGQMDSEYDYMFRLVNDVWRQESEFLETKGN